MPVLASEPPLIRLFPQSGERVTACHWQMGEPGSALLIQT